ncbi:MAG: type VII toxin-antitoxin system HepT family RNase toxin [Thermodesulfobium sp.]
MIESDVIFAKVANIQRCLKRISAITNNDPNSLEDIDKQDMFILNLQRAIESTIDIAAHIIASQGLGLATTIKENFKLLNDAGIIDADLTKRMQSMVGFRNIAIHDYASLDINILKSILQHNLKDIEEFYTLILKKFILV